ncbi:MAG: RluA family pseudouridine synthase [Planctomycetota bacterium]|nr:MAG: RluA family pseudouridine synthase [Planctomycetota bacterium]
MLDPLPPARARVPPALHGERLDRAASELLRLPVSRSRLSQWIRDGRLRVDGAVVVKPGTAVESGQELLLEPPELEPMGPAQAPAVLYEDEWLAILDKPAGLPMHGTAAGDPRPSVARFLHERYGPRLPINQGALRPGIVHRLDSETSGVCVVALEQTAFTNLQEQFAKRTVEKEYAAVVYGRPRFQSDWIDRPIARDPHHPERMRTVRALAEGVREALTFWEVVQRFRNCAHLRVQPRTGRTHQIRVHLAAVDLPLVGDWLYRARNYGPGLLPPGAPPVERPLLHSSALRFEHPALGQEMRFQVGMPQDMAELLAFLGAHAPAEDQGWK